MGAGKLLADIASTGAVRTSRAFDAVHPAVPALFFAAALVLCMAFLHPVLGALSLAGALAYSLLARGVRATGASLAMLVPLVVLVAAFNPFFSAQGETLVAQLLGRPLYAESLAFGVCMGLMLGSALLWLQNAAAALRFEDVLVLCGRAAPTLAFALSAMARLVPRYLRRGRQIAAVQQACTCARKAHNGAGPASAARRFVVLAASSMEDSLVSANSIAARGWNSGVRRSFYERVRFSRPDALWCVCVAALGALAAVAAWRVCAGFAFYPHMTALSWQPEYLAWALFFALPVLLEAKEVLSWKR